MMDLKITAEWLQSFDSDYEPSGLMTPRDRAELERRKAERLADEEQSVGSAKQAPAAEQTALAAN